jgi:hypothetical protein
MFFESLSDRTLSYRQYRLVIIYVSESVQIV